MILSSFSNSILALIQNQIHRNDFIFTIVCRVIELQSVGRNHWGTFLQTEPKVFPLFFSSVNLVTFLLSVWVFELWREKTLINWYLLNLSVVAFTWTFGSMVDHRTNINLPLYERHAPRYMCSLLQDWQFNWLSQVISSNCHELVGVPGIAEKKKKYFKMNQNFCKEVLF